MRKITVLLFISLNCISIFAQENFKPGFIVTQKGDTVRGLIDFRAWSRNPSQISFKQTETGEKKNYLPSEISAFSVEGETYIGEKVQVETSPYLLNELKADPELHLTTEDAFLYCMVEGKKPLYHYKDARDKDNFYIRSDSGVKLLIQKVYLREIQTKDMTDGTYADANSLFIGNNYYFKTENRKYLGQLSVYLNDCPDIPPMLSTVKYNQSDLLKLFNTYKKKCDNEIKTNSSRSAFVQFGIIAGLSMNSLTWGKNAIFHVSRTEYSYKPNVVIGVSLELKMRGHMNKWSVNNELLYAPFKVSGEYENFISEERYERISSEIGSQYFKMNNMIRFRYPVGSLAVFVNAGISNSYGNVKYNSIHTVTRNYGIMTDVYNVAMEETDKYELGFNLGGGIIFKKWSLEARWEQGDGMSALAAMKSHIKCLNFLMSYRLSKD